MGGLDGPPKPPALGHASAEPWRASGLLGGSGGSEMAAAASRGGTSRPGWAGALVVILRVRTGLLEDGLELELAADRPVGLHGLEAGHGVVVDVAVLVEAPLAVMPSKFLVEAIALRRASRFSVTSFAFSICGAARLMASTITRPPSAA